MSREYEVEQIRKITVRAENYFEALEEAYKEFRQFVSLSKETQITIKEVD